MKKIGKITINPEKVINNEELVNLRGGYGGGSGCVYVQCYTGIPGVYLGDLCAMDGLDYTQECKKHWTNAGASVFITNSSQCGC